VDPETRQELAALKRQSGWRVIATVGNSGVWLISSRDDPDHARAVDPTRGELYPPCDLELMLAECPLWGPVSGGRPRVASLFTKIRKIMPQPTDSADIWRFMPSFEGRSRDGTDYAFHVAMGGWEEDEPAANTSAMTDLAWSDEPVARALDQVESWFRSVPEFRSRVLIPGGTVVGFRSPAALSEHDLVLRTAHALNHNGVSWDDMHMEISASRAFFDGDHPAASLPKAVSQWRADLVLVRQSDLLDAKLPSIEVDTFAFDAVFEFAYAHNWWTQPGAELFGSDPAAKMRTKVEYDIDKVIRLLDAHACRRGYVIVFEESDHGLPVNLPARASERHRACDVRIIRSY
jgi:hypothetical protein